MCGKRKKSLCLFLRQRNMEYCRLAGHGLSLLFYRHSGGQAEPLFQLRIFFCQGATFMAKVFIFILQSAVFLFQQSNGFFQLLHAHLLSITGSLSSNTVFQLSPHHSFFRSEVGEPPSLSWS
jgi:hypothetical protein